MSRQWMRMMIVALTVGSVLPAAATNYFWKGTNNQKWSDISQWNPSGYPQAADDASFTGTVGMTANIANGFQAVNNVSVTGSGNWSWVATGVTNLAVGGTFTYDSTGTNSILQTPLLGNGKLVVNKGQLFTYLPPPLTNGLSRVTVNGGTLASGRSNNGANTNNFGNPDAIIEVGALSGTSDATIKFGSIYNTTFANIFTYPQPIIVRAGSTGRATLRFNGGSAGFGTYGAKLGGITLEKDVHLAGETYYCSTWWRGDGNPLSTGNLDVRGPITGTGSVYLDDIFGLHLSGTNSYTGQTIVNANYVWLKSSVNATTGNIIIARGALIANNDGALGIPANTVTLGGPGTFGNLCVWTNVDGKSVPIYRTVTLAGNGGFIMGFNNAAPLLYGPITGPGRLIIAHGQELWGPSYLYGANNYSGGTLVVDGNMSGSNNTAFGTGDIQVKFAGYLGISNAANVAAAAKLTVSRNPLLDACGNSGGEVGLYVDCVPPITANSNGKLAINLSSGTPLINAWLANGTQPIGDGSIFLTTWNSSTITATGLAALVASDPTHTYKLGTGMKGSDTSLNSAGTIIGALQDLNGQPHNVQFNRPNVGGRGNQSFTLWDDHPFSGTLSIYPGTYAYFRLPTGAGVNGLGAATGNVALFGHRDDNTVWRSLWIENYTTVSRTIRKNDLKVEGSAYVYVDAFSAGLPAWTTTVQVASLTRSNRSSLAIQGYRGFLGNRELFIVTNGVTSINGLAAVNGVVAPWLWNDRDLTFMDYGAMGLKTNLWDGYTLAAATAGSKIRMSASEQIPATGVQLYALCMSNCNVLANSGAVLTNLSGGMLLGGARTTNDVPLEFGANEAVVIARDSASLHFLNGAITGSGGLTKTGKGRLVLNANNIGLTGGITVNQGELQYTNAIHLGTNAITLNGGALLLRGAWTDPGPAITNNIILGPCGGIIGNTDNGGRGVLCGSISGPGWVRFQPNWGYRLYGVSSYSGGTIIEGMSGLNLYTNNALGVGPVSIGIGSGTHQNNNCALRVWHDAALNTNTLVEVKTRSSWLYLVSASPQLGSVEGNGFIVLGQTTSGTRATFGLDNRDAEYFGQIEVENDAYPGHLVKAGTGTWTLWGLVIANGSITVTNGTLRVNNWANTAAPVLVYPGATLDGIGTVGIVSNRGGTVKGNLYMRRLVMDGTSRLDVTLNGTNAVSQYGQLNVSDGITLNGTLNVTLGFVPAVGQSFTILNNTGTLTGTFGNSVTAIYDGRTYFFRIDYSGDDVVLTRLVTGTVMTIR